MPCRDDYGDNTVSQTTYDNMEAARDAIQKRCDLATRVACELASYLNIDEQHVSKEAKAWIKKHREADAKRKKQEEEQAARELEEKQRREKIQATRMTALKKLTREERNALGLPHPA